MTINVSFEQIKKAAAVALLAGNLFAIGAAANYVYWRITTNKAFTLLDFDIQSRLPEIKARILKLKAEEAAREAAAANQAATNPGAAEPEPPKATVPQPKKP